MPDDARPFSNCLLDLAPPDIAWFRERSDIVLVPIGSCEQHGAHLPLGRQPDQLAGHFQKPALEPRLARLPGAAAELVQCRLGAVGTEA